MKTSKAIAEMEKGAVVRSEASGGKYRIRKGEFQGMYYNTMWLDDILEAHEITGTWSIVTPAKRKKK